MKEVGAPLPLKYGGLAWDGEGTRKFRTRWVSPLRDFRPEVASTALGYSDK